MVRAGSVTLTTATGPSRSTPPSRPSSTMAARSGTRDADTAGDRRARWRFPPGPSSGGNPCTPSPRAWSRANSRCSPHATAVASPKWRLGRRRSRATACAGGARGRICPLARTSAARAVSPVTGTWCRPPSARASCIPTSPTPRAPAWTTRRPRCCSPRSPHQHLFTKGSKMP